MINHEVREAERERQYGEYKDRMGEIINGVVKRVEFYNVIVDLGRAEGVIRSRRAFRAKTFVSATAPARTFMTCAARAKARKSSCRAPSRNSWRACSRRKCRKFMKA